MSFLKSHRPEIDAENRFGAASVPTVRTWRYLGVLTLLCLSLMLGAGQKAQAQADTDADQGRRSVDVGVYVSPPFVSEQSGKYEGMAIDLWEMVAGKLGLATRYVAFTNLKDLVEATRTGKVDAAVTNLTITHKRAGIVSYTQPWYDAGLRIMVPETGSAGIQSVITGLRNAGHLRAYAWLAFVIVLATILITLFDRRFDRDFPRRWREGLAESFYQVMSVATSGKASRKNLFGWKGRIWSAIWMVFGVAVVAYITSSVTSVMTAVSIEQGVTSLADLPGKTSGVFTGSASEDYLNEIGIGTHSYPGLEEAVAALEAGRIEAIVADAPTLEHYVHVHPQRGMEVVGSLFHPDKYGFAFPLESDLTTPVTLEILSLQESGAIEDLRLEYFGNAL